MKLYLIRHAIAEEILPGQADDARPLSAKGIQRFKGVVRGLEELGIGFDRLYHSPKLRAVQTAELLVPLLEGETVVTPYLAAEPGLELLSSIAGESVALVGHEPWLGQLCTWLLTGRVSDSSFALKKGGVALLEGPIEPGGMKLVGLWPPSLLRRLGKPRSC